MTNFWSDRKNIIPIEEITALSTEVATAYSEFEQILKKTGVDVEDFACVGDDYASIEAASTEDLEPDEIYDLINEKWEKVAALALEKANIVIYLYYPEAEVVNEPRRAYCIVDNAYIPNPNIPQEIQDKINPTCFTLGN